MFYNNTLLEARYNDKIFYIPKNKIKADVNKVYSMNKIVVGDKKM